LAAVFPAFVLCNGGVGRFIIEKILSEVGIPFSSKAGEDADRGTTETLHNGDDLELQATMPEL
jgi:hypothetical protein